MDNPCTHSVYLHGLCGNCGARCDPPQSTSISMIHSVPELKVSEEYAKVLGKADQERLIKEGKLVLVVDLDQTVLHTTHEEIKNDPNVHSFTLWPGHPTYYTKLRPHLKIFLEEMSEIYELHIFTFGCHKYAHQIASIIDPNQKYFGHRILSRDESVNQSSKKESLHNLFPDGDSMVCIIDDRSDVWRDAANLIQVKPYTYFKTSISDGASKIEEDETLEREAGELEALMGLGDEEDEDKDEKGDKSNKNSVEATDKAIDVDEDEDDSSDDPDDHLLFLPLKLRQIHARWYQELEERRRFLVDGENYKLPDIKDIIAELKNSRQI